MQTNIVVAAAAVLVVAGGVFFYNVFTPEGEIMVKQGDAMMQEGDKMMAAGDEMKDKGTQMVEEGKKMLFTDEAGNEYMQDSGGEWTQKSEGTMTSAGSYEVYAPEKLARAETGDVVLFFRASWCPTCKAVDADIRAHLDQIPKGVTILDVNYDTATELKKKYGVTYQHTFVQVAADGTQIAKWSASPTLASLVSNIK